MTHTKFKIGDFVRFVDEPIEGYITSFQRDDIIGVTDESGFEIPVPANKITLVHGNMRREDDEEENLSSPVVNQGVFVEQGLYLAIAGDQDKGLARFYFVNHSSYNLLISASEINGTKRTTVFAEKVLAKDYIQFYSANFKQVSKWPNFDIQLIQSSQQPHQATSPMQKEFRFKPLDLLLAKELDELLDEKVWRYELDKPEENIGLDKLKEHFISHRPKRR